jgi:hypothetical protein
MEERRKGEMVSKNCSTNKERKIERKKAGKRGGCGVVREEKKKSQQGTQVDSRLTLSKE